MSQPTYQAKKRYDDKNTVHYGFKLNRKTDADIIEYLENADNKQGAIKDALREKIERDRD